MSSPLDHSFRSLHKHPERRLPEFLRDQFPAKIVQDATSGTPPRRRCPASPYYRRRFVPGETKEVRIYLHGGDDHVEHAGPPGGPIEVRAIADGGRNVVDDSRSGGTDVARRTEVLKETVVTADGRRESQSTRPSSRKSDRAFSTWSRC